MKRTTASRAAIEFIHSIHPLPCSNLLPSRFAPFPYRPTPSLSWFPHVSSAFLPAWPQPLYGPQPLPR